MMNRHVDVDTDAMQSIGDLAGKIIGGLKRERQWDGLQITEPGVIAGLDIEQYHHDPELFDAFSISSSGLRALMRRPAEYWWTSPYNPKREEQEDKKALNFGKAAHMLVLGEEGFAQQYALRPDHRPEDMDKPVKDRRAWNANANDCKAWLAEQARDGRTVITQTEIGHIKHMAAALAGKEAVRLGILNGRVERTICHKDDGIWLKARPDVLPNDSGDFVDLKTAASVDDDSLSKAIYAHGYHVQAGLMRMVVREVLGADAFSSFTFVFVEKGPPYDVRIKQLKDSDIDLGERQARQGLKVLRQCLASGTWPGFDGFNKEFSWVEMPGWSRTRIETELAAEAA